MQDTSTKQSRKEERRAQEKIIQDNSKARARNKRIIHYTILIVVISIVAYLIFLIAKPDNTPGKYDSFAQCITSKGAIMYGTNWCPHCQAQKKEFGNSFRYIIFIDCDANKVACDLAGAKGYPTWVFSDATSISGEQDFATLAERTGCSIN